MSTPSTANARLTGTTSGGDDPFFKAPDVAEYMGTSERFVRELIAEEKIETFRPGRRVLIRKSAVDKFIAAHTTPAVTAPTVRFRTR